MVRAVNLEHFIFACFLGGHGRLIDSGSLYEDLPKAKPGGIARQIK